MSTSGLSAIAEWQSWRVDIERAVLDSLLVRLAAWRARAEDVGRGLGQAECWSGDAAQAASARVVAMSGVMTAVTAAMQTSLDGLASVVTAAGTAADSAEQALALARSVPVQLDESGLLRAQPPTPPPGTSPDPEIAHQQQLDAAAGQLLVVAQAQSLAAAAIRAADLAEQAGWDAGTALSVVGVVDGRAPEHFDDLAAAVSLGGGPPPGRSTVVPAGAGAAREAAAAADWWASLSEGQREGWIANAPELVGVTDGIPAWARDRANRLLLAAVLDDPAAPGHDVAAGTAAEIERREAAGQQVQLHTFVPGERLVGLVLGDLDTAHDVAVIVPGTGTDPVGQLDDVTDQAVVLQEAALAAGAAGGVAVLSWLGYQAPPGVVDAMDRRRAEAGGRALDSALHGVGAARTADLTLPGPAQVTVVAHSYGAVVVDEAVGETGSLAADDVILLGSPGTEHVADEMEADEVYEASGGQDLVAASEWHGTASWRDGFDGEGLPTEWDMGHSEYFAADRPTLAAMAEVIAQG